MKPYFQLLLCLGFGCLWAAGFSLAAEPDGGAVSIRFSAIAWEAPIENLQAGAGSAVVPLSIPAFQRSIDYAYRGANPVVFFKRDDLRKIPVAQVAVPEGWRRVLFLFLPAGDGTFTVSPLNDDHARFPADSARIINITPGTLAVKCFGEGFELQSGETRILSLPEGRKRRIPLQVAELKNDRWRLVAENMFTLGEGGRRTIVLTKSDSRFFRGITEGGSAMPADPLQIFTFEETVQDETKEDAR